MKLVARDKLDAEPLLDGIGPRAARQCLRCGDAGCRLRGERRPASRRRCWTNGSSPASATSMPAKRCIARCCRPSAWHRRSPSKSRRAQQERAERLVDGISRRCCSNDAIKAGGSSLARSPTDARRRSPGMFQHHFRVYGREGAALRDAALPRDGQAHRAGMAARPFIARYARSEFHLSPCTGRGRIAQQSG